MGRSFLWMLLFLVALTGCTSVPHGKSGIDEVTVHNADAIDESDTEGKIATAETPKFLGFFRGVVYDYEVFDRFVLQRDLARVERFYRARGFYDAHARAGRVIQKNNNHVRVEIVVEEGQPTLVKDLEIAWPPGAPVSDAIKLKAYLAAKGLLPPEKPFDEDNFAKAQDSVLKAVTDAGFAYAKVSRNANVDIATHTATVTYTVMPDLPAKFGKITIKGLDPDSSGPLHAEIPEDKVRSTINIDEGQPYSTAEIDSASSALTDLEVFSSVRIVPQLSDPPPADHVVPLLVTVEPAKLRSLKLGGGVELDSLKTDVHGVVGWEDHNFLGNLRDLEVNFKPGVVLYPTRLAGGELVPPSKLLPEEKLSINFKQPSFLEARTEGFIKPEFNVYPILVPAYKTAVAAVPATATTPAVPAVPADPIIGYMEPKASVGLDRLIYRKLLVKLSYTEQIESPFNYISAPAVQLTTISIAYPELQAQLNLTDNKLHPHTGFYLGNILQWALLGTAHDVKIQPEGRLYIPIGKKITWATRASVGLLFPSNWGGYIKDKTSTGQSALGDSPTKADGSLNVESGEVRDLEVDLFRGFYSGGPSSNRGYAVRSIGPYAFVPFLNPASVTNQFKAGESCVSAVTSAQNGHAVSAPSNCDSPVGGMSLWEASTELRIDIAGPLSIATFLDAGDVSPYVADIRLNYPHMSVGAGARYDTPVGPLRVDLGYRLGGAFYAPSNAPFDAPKGVNSDLYGNIATLPLAISAGIGEAF